MRSHTLDGEFQYNMYQVVITVDPSEIVSLKTEIDLIQAYRMTALATSVKSSVEKIQDRIEKGKLSNGSIMVSKSTKKDGRYSKSWGKKRRKEGLKVDLVNLSFTGKTRKNFKLLDDFNALKTDSYNVGLETEESDTIAGYNNDYFGPAYDYSQGEIDDTFRQYKRLFASELIDR